MSAYLGFTLYAPLGSFGALAVGERRESWDRPAKSAVLGLMGAALGLDRADQEAQAALAAGYGYAVRTDEPGKPLADYHTAQVPPRRRGFPTRRDELASGKLETILSRRDYRTEALHTAVLWARAGAPMTLEAISMALREPSFVLYLGRKSCPLGLPLAPRLVEADTIFAAFDAYDDAMSAPERALREELGLMPRSHAQIAADLDAVVGGRGHEIQRQRRRDEFLDRRRWRFGLRDELILSPVRASSP